MQYVKIYKNEVEINKTCVRVLINPPFLLSFLEKLFPVNAKCLYKYFINPGDTSYRLPDMIVDNIFSLYSTHQSPIIRENLHIEVKKFMEASEQI